MPWPAVRAGTNFRTAAVRDGDWKLIHHRDKEKVELFDLGRDPNETTDLSAAEPERVERLQRLLDAMSQADVAKGRKGGGR
jgi:arylsulfatase A-like enzyme